MAKITELTPAATAAELAERVGNLKRGKRDEAPVDAPSPVQLTRKEVRELETAKDLLPTEVRVIAFKQETNGQWAIISDYNPDDINASGGVELFVSRILGPQYGGTPRNFKFEIKDQLGNIQKTSVVPYAGKPQEVKSPADDTASLASTLARAQRESLTEWRTQEEQRRRDDEKRQDAMLQMMRDNHKAQLDSMKSVYDARQVPFMPPANDPISTMMMMRNLERNDSAGSIATAIQSALKPVLDIVGSLADKIKSMEEQRARAAFERPPHLAMPPLPVHKDSDLAEVLKSFVPLAQEAMRAVVNKPQPVIQTWSIEKILALLPTVRETLSELSGTRNVQMMMEKSDKLVEKLLENPSRSKRDLQDVIEAIGVMRRAAQEFAPPKSEGPTLADVMEKMINGLPDVISAFKGQGGNSGQRQTEASPYPAGFATTIVKLKSAQPGDETTKVLIEAYQCLATDERWGPRIQAMAKQIGPNNKAELIKLFQNILVDAVVEAWIAQSDMAPIMAKVTNAVNQMLQ